MQEKARINVHEAFLLVERDKFNNLEEFLQNFDKRDLKHYYQIFRQGNLPGIVHEIITFNAAVIYGKELDIDEFDLKELGNIGFALSKAIILYYLYDNGFIKEPCNDFFKYLYRIVSDKTNTLKESDIIKLDRIKIYLAIPYSGMEESAYKQATEITSSLLIENYNVFSPITHSHPLTRTSTNLPGNWEFWSQIDYQFLDWADELWVLIPEEGEDMVKQSKGVNGEIEYFKTLGRPIKYIKSDTV